MKGRLKEHLVIGHWMADQQFSVSFKKKEGTGKSTAQGRESKLADMGVGVRWDGRRPGSRSRATICGMGSVSVSQARCPPHPVQCERC